MTHFLHDGAGPCCRGDGRSEEYKDTMGYVIGMLLHLKGHYIENGFDQDVKELLINQSI